MGFRGENWVGWVKFGCVKMDRDNKRVKTNLTQIYLGQNELGNALVTSQTPPAQLLLRFNNLIYFL